MAAKTEITLKVCESALFGDADLDGVDVKASVEKYVRMAEALATQQYPGAEITVIYGDYVSGDEVNINGMTDNDASEELRISTGEMWSDFKWLVHKPTAKQNAIVEQFNKTDTWAETTHVEFNHTTLDLHIVLVSEYSLKTVTIKPDGQFMVRYDKKVKQ